MARETPHGTHAASAPTPAWLGEPDELGADELGPDELGPDDHGSGAGAPQSREPVPLPGLPLWPSSEPVTVSYVKPSWDEPTRSWTHDGWDPPSDRPAARGPVPRRDIDDHDAGLGSLGLVTITGRRPMRPPAAPIRPARPPRQGTAAGLAALVVIALLSAFFAWVTAEPLWLALGHSTPGTVTVTTCVDHGLNRRCAGTFTSAGGRFTRAPVQVMGDVPAPGGSAPATMTSDRGARAYVEVDAGGRATLGVGLVVLCALAIVRVTGVRRLPARRMRVTATVISFAGPLAFLAGMLVATF
jgi:hypothetical protein